MSVFWVGRLLLHSVVRHTMFLRITSVVCCMATAAWLSSAPAWNSALAFITAVLGYAGIEIKQHGEKIKEAQDRDRVLKDLQSHDIVSEYAQDPFWPNTALKIVGPFTKVCYHCLVTKKVALPLVQTSDKKKWTCAGCHTELIDPYA